MAHDTESLSSIPETLLGLFTTSSTYLMSYHPFPPLFPPLSCTKFHRKENIMSLGDNILPLRTASKGPHSYFEFSLFFRCMGKNSKKETPGINFWHDHPFGLYEIRIVGWCPLVHSFICKAAMELIAMMRRWHTKSSFFYFWNPLIDHLVVSQQAGDSFRFLRVSSKICVPTT